MPARSGVRCSDLLGDSSFAGDIYVSNMALTCRAQSPNVRPNLIALPLYAKLNRPTMQNPNTVRPNLNPQWLQIKNDVRERWVGDGKLDKLIRADRMLSNQLVECLGKIGVISGALVSESGILSQARAEKEKTEKANHQRR